MVPGEPFTVDLLSALRRVVAEGHAHLRGVLEEADLDALLREIRDLPFEPAPPSPGEVRQELDAAALPPDLRRFPNVARLREGLMAAAAASGIRGLRTWRPNDIAAQRYRVGSLGITSHRDGKRFRRLVAVVTIAGSAEFAVRRERHGEVVARWVSGAGSLVLLRGPGLAGARDGRPFHEVSGPLEGVRYSVGFRMETGS